MTDEYRSGFASVVGRPNAGKSTLVNALVGEQVAAVADQSHTTRQTIRGIVQYPAGQLVVLDTPGLHKPQSLLGKRLNAQVRAAWSQSDLILIVVAADARLGTGDKFMIEQVRRAKTNKMQILGIVSKVDTVSPDLVDVRQQELTEALPEPIGVVPVSAVTGVGLLELRDQLYAALPVGPQLYDDEVATDQSLETRIADLVRGSALGLLEDELPHSLAVVVDDIDASRPTLHVEATVFVERDSQKGIVIGKRGSGIKTIGETSRKKLEEILGQPVYLQLRVKVAKNWQSDPKQLNRFGF